MNTEIDVAAAGHLSSTAHVWGWEIPVYLFLGGLAAGIMILLPRMLSADSRSRSLRLLAFAPPLLVSAGMLALFIDLANKQHVLRFYLALRPLSPMSWGAWILVLVYPVTLLFALGALDAPGFAQAQRIAARLGLAGVLTRLWAFALDRERALRSAMVVLGVALGVYTGVLLSTLGARALWSSALLAPLFLVSGVSTGAAFLMLFRVSAEERHSLARIDRAAMALELVAIALLLVGLATSGAPGRTAADLLLGGRYTAQFWTLVVFAGILLPAALEVLGQRMRLPVTRVVPLLVLAGGLALRWIVVGAGQA